MPRNETQVRAVEARFFGALEQGDTEALDRVLSDDFVLIDVLSGSEVSRASLLAIVGSGELAFESIEPLEVRIRVHGDAAIATGRTTMRMRYRQQPVTTRSRYTHVYLRQNGEWRLASAQGTPITA